MLTFLPLEQIDEMDKWEGSQLNTAKEILAYELTKLVHGEEEAEKAQAAAKALFSSGNAANMPTYELTEDDFVPFRGKKKCRAGRRICRRKPGKRYQGSLHEGSARWRRNGCQER